ncbi:hypothetical protein FHX09_003144 [Rhizobium sp. BK538]|nr:hypothetical protein [Rhizobium sp. BK060]MBB4169293.1 hypothetical protein [Rhizobium sp. BK538]
MDLNRATDGLNSTREFRNKSVTRAAKYTTAVLANQRSNPIVAQAERANRALLIQRRKAAEAGNVCGEDGCKLSIH